MYNYESQWSIDNTVLNTAVVIYLKLSNVYNSIIIDVNYFCILVVGCIYLRAFHAMSMSINKN